MTQALKAVEKDDVGCMAPIINFPSSELHNFKTTPFFCFFADNKSLTIEARNLAKLPNGETVPLEQLLNDKNIPQGTSIQFHLTFWKWTDTIH